MLAQAQGTGVDPIGAKVIHTSLAYGVDPIPALEVLKCESGLRHSGVYGDQGAAYGVAQFHRPTFEMFKREIGASYLDYKDLDSQIELFVWALKNGKASHWTCARKIGLA